MTDYRDRARDADLLLFARRKYLHYRSGSGERKAKLSFGQLA